MTTTTTTNNNNDNNNNTNNNIEYVYKTYHITYYVKHTVCFTI